MKRMLATTRLTPITAACLLMVGLFASAAIADEGTYDLGPRWVEGQTATYRGTTTRMTTTKVKAPDLDPPANSNVTRYVSEVKWEVDKVADDGSVEATMTVTDMYVVLEGPDGEEMKVDRKSADERLKPLQTLVKALIGTPVKVELDATGHVTKIDGWQAVRDNAGPAGKALTKRDFEESASELAALMGGAAGVAPGDSWNEKPQWDHELGTIEYDSQYTLSGVEQIADVPIAIVNEKAKMKIIPDKDKLKGPGGAEIKLDVKQAQRNTQIMFDLSRHEVVGSHADQTLNVQMSFTLQGKSFVTTITQQTSSQLIRLSEE